MTELPFLAGEQGRGSILVLLFFISATVVTVWGIWEGTLPGTEEAVMAEVAREIVETGDGWNLHFDGEPVYDTPPFALWLMASFFKVFGSSEFEARLPFVLFAVLTFFVTFMACTDTADEGRDPRRWITRSRAEGLLSAVILAASPLFARYAPHITTGIPLAFFTTLSVLGWLCLPERKYGLTLWGIGIAGGMLAAGAGGLLVIPGSLLALVFCRKCRAVWRSPGFIGVTVAAVLVGCSWLLPAAAAAPGGIRSSGLWRIIFGIVDPKAGAVSSLFLNIKEIWIMNLPWSIPLTAAVIRVTFFRGKDRRPGNMFELDYTLLSFALVLFVPVALTMSSLDAFLPLVPVLAVLSAREIARWLERPGHETYSAATGPAGEESAASGTAGLRHGGEGGKAAGSYPGGETKEAAVRRIWTFNQAMTAIFCLLMLLLVATPLRLHRSYADPVKDIAVTAGRMVEPGTRLGNYRQDYRINAARLLFYGSISLDQPCGAPDDVIEALKKDPDKIFLSTLDDLGAMQRLESFPYKLDMLYRAGNLVLFGLVEGGRQ